MRKPLKCWSRVHSSIFLATRSKVRRNLEKIQLFPKLVFLTIEKYAYYNWGYTLDMDQPIKKSADSVDMRLGRVLKNNLQKSDGLTISLFAATTGFLCVLPSTCWHPPASRKYNLDDVETVREVTIWGHHCRWRHNWILDFNNKTTTKNKFSEKRILKVRDCSKT